MKEVATVYTKKQWLVRIVAGGVLGMALLCLVGGLFNSLVNGGLIAMGTYDRVQPVSRDLARLAGSDALALAIQLALYFALGAGLGAATLPFAEDGTWLVLCSLLHFAYTAAVCSALVWLCGWNWGKWSVWLAELALLAGVYLLIWLVRWLFWYAELRAIRAKLGLRGGKGPLEEEKKP